MEADGLRGDGQCEQVDRSGGRGDVGRRSEDQVAVKSCLDRDGRRWVDIGSLWRDSLRL